jgi:hypothetical protein
MQKGVDSCILNKLELDLLDDNQASTLRQNQTQIFENTVNALETKCSRGNVQVLMSRRYFIGMIIFLIFK